MCPANQRVPVSGPRKIRKPKNYIIEFDKLFRKDRVLKFLQFVMQQLRRIEQGHNVETFNPHFNKLVATGGDNKNNLKALLHEEAD